MNIGEMHVTFRELAQQMGMQTVRAILMEDIDICLNAAIIEKARNVIVENVGPVPLPVISPPLTVPAVYKVLRALTGLIEAFCRATLSL
jgi:hypothetical protein